MKHYQCACGHCCRNSQSCESTRRTVNYALQASAVYGTFIKQAFLFFQEAKCSYKTVTWVLGELKRVPNMYQRRGMTTRGVGIADQADRCQLSAHADLGLAQGLHRTLCRHPLCRHCPGWAFLEEKYLYPSLIAVPIPIWRVLKEFFGMFWGDLFFLIQYLYHHPLSRVTGKEKERKNKPKGMNLGRNDHWPSAASSWMSPADSTLWAASHVPAGDVLVVCWALCGGGRSRERHSSRSCLQHYVHYQGDWFKKLDLIFK